MSGCIGRIWSIANQSQILSSAISKTESVERSEDRILKCWECDVYGINRGTTCNS